MVDGKCEFDYCCQSENPDFPGLHPIVSLLAFDSGLIAGSLCVIGSSVCYMADADYRREVTN